MNQLEDCLDIFPGKSGVWPAPPGILEKVCLLWPLRRFGPGDFPGPGRTGKPGRFPPEELPGPEEDVRFRPAFYQALAESRFTGVEPEAILEAWFGALPQTRASQRGEKKEAWQRFFRKQLTETEDELACSWLTGILEENPKTEPSRRVFLREWNRAWETGRRDTFEDGVRLACRILENLPFGRNSICPAGLCRPAYRTIPMPLTGGGPVLAS